MICIKCNNPAPRTADRMCYLCRDKLRQIELDKQRYIRDRFNQFYTVLVEGEGYDRLLVAKEVLRAACSKVVGLVSPGQLTAWITEFRRDNKWKETYR